MYIESRLKINVGITFILSPIERDKGMLHTNSKKQSELPAFIYYIFRLENDKIKIFNALYPLIYSIKTIRKFNKNLPIYVIDASSSQHIWEDWPAILDFRVINIDSYFSKKGYSNNFQNFILSKPIDVYNFSKKIINKTIVCLDADIFWCKNPLPLQSDGNFFTFGEDQNSGFFYFSKNSDGETFMKIWTFFIEQMMCDLNFRREIASWCSAENLYGRDYSDWENCYMPEEAILLYVREKFSHLVKETSDIIPLSRMYDDEIKQKGIHVVQMKHDTPGFWLDGVFEIPEFAYLKGLCTNTNY